MKMKLQRVNGSQFSLASAISIGLFSLICIPIFILISVFGGTTNKFIWIFGLLIPIFYFVFSYLMTRIFIWLFNISTRWIHGIEIDIDNKISIEETIADKQQV